MIEKSKRWPLIVVTILLVTILVNIAFAWVAVSDKTGGFELMNKEGEDASYRLKVPLSEQKAD